MNLVSIRNIHFFLLPFALGWLSIFRGAAQPGEQVAIPPVPDLHIDDWFFFPGSPDEDLQISEIPAYPSWQKKIRLPHRIHLPDQSLWYHTRLSLTSDRILRLDADDGAQVFWQGRRIYRKSPGETFLLHSGSDHELVVRVLNNAGSGGLRQAVLRDPQQVENEERHLAESCRQENDRYSRQYLTGTSTLPEGLRWQAGPVCLPYGQSGWRIWFQADWSGPNTPVLLLKRNGALLRQGITGVFQSGNWWFSLPEDLPVGLISYSIQIDECVVGPFSLTLPNLLTDSITVTVFGDSQNGLDTFRALLSLPEIGQSDLILGLGDLVANGSDSMQWIRFFRELMPAASSKPCLLVPGNHDTDGWYDDLDPSFIHRYLSNGQGDRRFFRRVGPLAILGLDPNETFPIGIRGETYAWMLEQINQSEWLDAPWKILAIHQPPYAQGWIGYEGDFFCRQLVHTIRQIGGLDLVLAGHNHDYERLTLFHDSTPLSCLILGGAGGHLEGQGEHPTPVMDQLVKRHHIGILQADPHQLAFRILDTSGAAIDEFRLSKKTASIFKAH